MIRGHHAHLTPSGTQSGTQIVKEMTTDCLPHQGRKSSKRWPMIASLIRDACTIRQRDGRYPTPTRPHHTLGRPSYRNQSSSGPLRAHQGHSVPSYRNQSSSGPLRAHQSHSVKLVPQSELIRATQSSSVPLSPIVPQSELIRATQSSSVPLSPIVPITRPRRRPASHPPPPVHRSQSRCHPWPRGCRALPSCTSFRSPFGRKRSTWHTRR